MIILIQLNKIEYFYLLIGYVLFKATNSRTNHVELPSIGSKNANANQNNQSPKRNLNWAIRSETPPQKRSPTPEVPFHSELIVNNSSLNATAQDNKPTDDINQRSHV